MKTGNLFLHGFWGISSLLSLLLLTAGKFHPVPAAQAGDPNPPDRVVKLIFIHHSTGENWLTDGYGDLGRTLDQNNYFVSDTNYGWGPNAIGDRTDIPDWVEWFRSADSPAYTDALFNENGQHSSYTRTLSDPGGENEILMFKSCFPNSALEGNPGDPPDPEGWLSVGHAKYVYNEILQYFATRPDKLFVVITAPPLSDPTHAENARAFNQWLVNDWLGENSYELNNVFVFDFYNVLTGPDAHHRYNNGGIDHILGGQNTLYYPSSDDHPSESGSRKATEELVPLLNFFYHRWQADAPLPSEPEPASPAEATSQPEEYPAQPLAPSLIADFENLTPYLNVYWDESSNTRISCGVSSDNAYSGSSSLRIDFDVAPAAWATCVISSGSVQNWSNGQGLSFAIHAQQAGVPYDINIYSGSQEAWETYLDSASTPADSVSGWATVDIPWNEFHRADWEEDAGAVFDKPDQIYQIAFGFNGLEAENNTSSIWIDDLTLLGAEPVEVTPPPALPTKSPADSKGDSKQPSRPLLPCGGAIAAPLLLAGLSFLHKK